MLSPFQSAFFTLTINFLLELYSRSVFRQSLIVVEEFLQSLHKEILGFVLRNEITKGTYEGLLVTRADH